MTRQVRFATVATVALVMGVLDALWISLVASELYRDQLGAAVAETPRWGPAMGFYVIYWGALCYFVVLPGLTRSRPRVLLDAALLGVTAYGTWALTGWAVLADVNAAVALSDLVWGPVMSVATTAAALTVAHLVTAREQRREQA